MARSKWVPPLAPDPNTLTDPPPFAPFPLIHLRAGKVKKFGPFESAIFKAPLLGPVEITTDGIKGDTHSFEGHISPDKALLHYCTKHYDSWKKELPASESHFKPGAFGENLYNAEIDETTVCIGDQIAIGDIIVEVSEPRGPCAKLNHRFEVKDMALRAQRLLRTGWLYRIITPGTVQAGDMIRLLKRPYPEWTVARIMYYLFLDTKDVEMMKQIVNLPPLGWDIKDKFRARLASGETEDQNGRLYGGEDFKMDLWSEYRIVEKRKETSRVTAFALESMDEISDPTLVLPGSHVRLKLGGKLVRAYSVVSGTSKRFELGISLSSKSRGGSKYLHEQANVGDVLTVGRITASFPLATNAHEHVIIAAGIGITAFLPAVKYLQQMKQKFHLHYAHAGEMPFASQINALGSNATTYDKSLGRRLIISDIISRADKCAHIYTCGPERLMDDVVATAKKYDFPDSSVHLEQFVVAASGDPFTVELKESKKTIEVGPTQTLLDALKAMGMDIDSSCEVGNCGTCKVDVCSGKIEHRGTGLLDSEKDESMLSCVSRGIGTIVLDL
ncbi:PK beta-barrel-protein domain-containing protein-like protein [Ophiobolus disseminans]|uniref:PK beta-barrel-protein domain-containing protein-like protein n=1 Tax=Ophiobolus disseminans TaxID=1469910 RepID=A0A6A6ZW74_9PLEO|nr:PK beta-barrel-protein domain-containing protein-like protein [Ophiobolus disseminans]